MITNIQRELEQEIKAEYLRLRGVPIDEVGILRILSLVQAWGGSLGKKELRNKVRLAIFRQACKDAQREDAQERGVTRVQRAAQRGEVDETFEERLAKAKEELDAVLDTLRPQHGQAIYARFILGLERQNLASYLAVEEDCAYQWISRGRKKLLESGALSADARWLVTSHVFGGTLVGKRNPRASEHGYRSKKNLLKKALRPTKFNCKGEEK